MKESISKKQTPPPTPGRNFKRRDLSKLLLAAYVRHARDPLTRRAVRQCIG